MISIRIKTLEEKLYFAKGCGSFPLLSLRTAVKRIITHCYNYDWFHGSSAALPWKQRKKNLVDQPSKSVCSKLTAREELLDRHWATFIFGIQLNNMHRALEVGDKALHSTKAECYPLDIKGLFKFGSFLNLSLLHWTTRKFFVLLCQKRNSWTFLQFWKSRMKYLIGAVIE